MVAEAMTAVDHEMSLTKFPVVPGPLSPEVPTTSS